MDFLFHVLLRVNADFSSFLSGLFEFDRTSNEGKKGMVLAQADVVARADAGSPLPDQNSAGRNLLTTVSLDAQALGLAVTPAARAAASLLMCH